MLCIAITSKPPAPRNTRQLRSSSASDDYKRQVVLVPYGGVRRENPMLTATLADAVAGRPRWRTLARMEDRATGFALRGRDAFVISERDAPLGRILKLDAADPDMARAQIVVAEATAPIETSDTGLVAARYGLPYVRQNGRSTPRPPSVIPTCPSS